MPINVSEERKRIFEQRIANWLASQGLLFQLRYASAGSSGGAFGGVLNIVLRLLLVLLVGGFLLFFAGNGWMASASFQNGLGKKLETIFKADGMELGGFSKEAGRAVYKKIKLEGSEGSFFEDGELQTVSANMPFSSLWKKGWQAGEINMASARLNLKSGGDKKMEGIYDVLFSDQSGFNFSALTIKSTTLEWGYSKLTHGSIRDSQLKAFREGEAWKLHFEGGYFQQNWIQKLQIKEMHLTLNKNGIKVDSAEFLIGKNGRATLSGKIGGTAARPELALVMNMEHIPIETMLNINQVDLGNFLQGEFGGKFTIFGTSDQVIKTKGDVFFDDDQLLILRDGWPILKALSLVDTNKSYRRLSISKGGFSFETSNGEMRVKDFLISEPDLFVLKGAFETRLPSQKEAAKTLNIELSRGKSGPLDISNALRLEGERMSLNDKTPRETKSENKERKNLGKKTFDEKLQKMTEDDIAGLRIRQEMATHIFVGKMQVGVKSSAFGKNKRLLASYPPKGEPAWSWIPLELNTRLALISKLESEALLLETRREGLQVSDEAFEKIFE